MLALERHQPVPINTVRQSLACGIVVAHVCALHVCGYAVQYIARISIHVLSVYHTWQTASYKAGGTHDRQAEGFVQCKVHADVLQNAITPNSAAPAYAH